MKICPLNTNQSDNFGGKHLSPRHIKFFKTIRTERIEDELKSKGIKASFKGKRVIAGLSYFTLKLADALGLSLPAEFGIRKTPKTAIAQSWFNKDRKPHVFLNLAVQYGRGGMFSSLKRLERYMYSEKHRFGTSHFMNIPLHEAMHCDLFKKIQDKYGYWHLKWDKVLLKKFSKIDISPFRSEIAKKIGAYANEDAVELHAVYWAKEICRSLNSNFELRYNPFECPNIKLSPLLREFIDKITAADYNGAVAVSKQAKKLQKTV